MTPALVVAAPASGHGKTVICAATLRAFVRRGLRVCPFKVGPDYIDPAFLAAAAGRPAYSLDPWAMRPELTAATLATAADGELALIEGVTGLFDGAADDSGSTADLAASLGLRVVLAVDVRGMGASVAALVAGFQRHRPDVEVAGVILNRVGSARHEQILRRALAGVEVLGCVPRDAALELPSRHLGLVQAVEHGSLETFLDRAAAIVARQVDLDRLQALARPLPPHVASATMQGPLPPLGQNLAVARDQAFAFAYPAVLDGWRRAGCSLTFFSPLADESPDAAADAVYLPGGYPELHGQHLASCDRLLSGLRAAAAKGAAILSECGGYMLLGRALIDRDGHAWPMAGLLPVTTSFATPRLHLGYRAMTTLAATPLGPVGTLFRGHEFHYASELERRDPPLFHATTADGRDLDPQGCVQGRVLGSFLHLIDRLAKPAPGT